MANYVVSGGKLGDPQVESGVISSGAAAEEDLSLAAAESGAVFSVDSGEQDQPAAAAVQYVRLDFDGEKTRYRNRDLGLDFAVTVKDSGFSDDEKQDILSALAAGHPDVVFTLDKPENETTEYSTVFIGKSGDFEGYGTFLGLAETIDIGNQVKNDNAFVLLDRTADLSQVISVTDHELGHIVLGQKHDMQSESLYDYAASLVSSQTTTLTIKVSRSGGTTPGDAVAETKTWSTSMPAGATYANVTITNKGETSRTRYEKAYIDIILNFNGKSYTINPEKSETFTIYADSTFSITRKAYLDLEVSGYNYDKIWIGSPTGYYYPFMGYSYFSGTSINTVSITADYYGDSVLTPTPTPTPTQPSTAKPDLTIIWVDTFEFSPDNGAYRSCHDFDGNDSIRVKMYVSNESATASAACRASVTLGKVTKYVDVPALGANASRSIDCVFTVQELGQRGSLSLSAKIDCTGVVSESNENNNYQAGDATVYIGDRTPPEKPVARADTTDYTFGAVIVTAAFSEDSAKREYSFDGKTWMDYSVGIRFTQNGTVYFRGTDAAGNVSEVTSYTVNNIILSDSTTPFVISSSLTIGAGNALSGTSVVSGGHLYVANGGTVNNTTVNAWGKLYVENGGMANNATINFGGVMTVSSGGMANFTFVDKGDVSVFGGGMVNNTTINSGGHMYVSSGGTANSAILNTSGWMWISQGGMANNVIANSSGWAVVSSGGTVNTATVNSGGYVIVSSGGAVNTATVNSGGVMHVLDGCKALQIVENGGRVLVEDGAEVTFAPNCFSGLMLSSSSATLHSGTTANSSLVNYRGTLYVSSGGVANAVIVDSGGWMWVSQGGMANNAVVRSGYMYVMPDGVVQSVAINSGGDAVVKSGGVIRGSLQIEAGAVVSAYAGAVIDFTVDGRTINDGYLINNLSLISGTPNFTITVSGFQSGGTYKLAQGASQISGQLSIGTETTDFGMITVNGGAATYGRRDYRLSQSGGNLILQISPNADLVRVYSSGTVVSGGDTLSGKKLAGGGNNSMSVFEGGIAADAAVNRGGRMDVGLWGTASATTVNAGGTVILSSGAIAKTTTVNSGGGLHVYSGATANGTTVNQSGYLGVGNGATTVSTTVGEIGEVTIWGGGVASQSVIETWGAMILSSGARADGTKIRDKGGLHVYSGAAADYTTVDQGGIFGVGDGAVVNNTVIAPYGELKVWGGGTANQTNIASGGALILLSGAVASGTEIQSAGGLHVYSGATADATTVYQGGIFGVGDGAVVRNTAIGEYGELKVWGGGRADRTDIDSDGALILLSGAAASRTTIHSGGGLHVYSGAFADNTTVYQGGYFGVGNGANVVATTVGEAGEVVVWGGGYAARNVIETRGAMILSSGAQAVQTDIRANGGLHIYAGARADGVTIRNGAALGIGGGGLVTGVTEEYGASMVFYEGSQVAGRLLMGGSVTVNGTLDGSTAEFVFDLTNRTGADGIILNSLQAVTNTSFQVSVSSSQQAGWYSLAGNAYAASLTLCVDAAAAGGISVGGGALQLGDASYSLGLSGDGILYLEIARSSAPMSAQLPEPALDSFADDAAEPFSAASALWDNDLGLDGFSNDTWSTAFLSDADLLKFKPSTGEVAGMLA